MYKKENAKHLGLTSIAIMVLMGSQAFGSDEPLRGEGEVNNVTARTTDAQRPQSDGTNTNNNSFTGENASQKSSDMEKPGSRASSQKSGDSPEKDSGANATTKGSTFLTPMEFLRASMGEEAYREYERQCNLKAEEDRRKLEENPARKFVDEYVAGGCVEELTREKLELLLKAANEYSFASLRERFREKVKEFGLDIPAVCSEQEEKLFAMWWEIAKEKHGK